MPADLVINVTQSLGRKPWRVGGLPAPTTSSKFFYQGSELSAREVLTCLGWPTTTQAGVATPVFPPELTKTQIMTLIGNIIAPPMIGGILLGVFGAIKVGSIDLRKPSLPEP